jgi:DNA-binding winged helix-turn-helix (wHTH) protein
VSVSTFGDFEFSHRALRLTRLGTRVRLTGHPLRLLLLLLEEPGRLVTREEIRARLWPDTTVDFDHGLDVALNRLRRALGDSRRDPRFIETVPRPGYRFVAPVAKSDDTPRRRIRPVAFRAGVYAATAILGALLALAIVHQHYDKIVSRSPRVSDR